MVEVNLVNNGGRRGIVTDVFGQFYESLLNACGQGVKKVNNTIYLDNKNLRGHIDFFPLGPEMALYGFNLTGSEEGIIFKIDATKESEYYSFVFSLKEIPDQHKFDLNISGEDSTRFGTFSMQSAYYASSNVPSSLIFSPGKGARIIFVRMPLKEINRSLFFLSSDNKAEDQTSGDPVKGYVAMDVKMIDEVNSIFENNYTSEVQPFYIKGIIYRLLAMLINEIKLQNERLISESGVTEAARMVQLKNLLINDFSKPCPRIEEIAKKAYMSVSKFQHTFKQLFKMSYYQYYQHYRLMSARHLLSLGMPVKDVAFAVGFVNHAQFTAAFKKKFNMLPSEIK